MAKKYTTNYGSESNTYLGLLGEVMPIIKY